MENKVKEYLYTKHVNVPEQWIPDCIDFIKSEYDYKYSTDVIWLKEKVYEQWLHSDLTELGVSCLPKNILSEKCMILKGIFILQVNQIKDIGFSAYAQLKKLSKDDNGNSNVSADKQYTAAWEPKSTRMFMLQLTDGSTGVQAIEYRHIPALSPAMKSGCKILLKGVMEARRGVILLSSHHVSVLGGEVDSMAVPYAAENVLRRDLGLETTQRPADVPASFSASDATDQSQVSHYYPSQSTQFSTSRKPLAQPVAAAPIQDSMAKADFAEEDDLMDSEMEMALLEAEQSVLCNMSKPKSALKSNRGGIPGNEASDKVNKECFNSRIVENPRNVKSLRSNVGEEDDFDDDVLMAAMDMDIDQLTVPSIGKNTSYPNFADNRAVSIKSTPTAIFTSAQFTKTTGVSPLLKTNTLGEDRDVKKEPENVFIPSPILNLKPISVTPLAKKTEPFQDLYKPSKNIKTTKVKSEKMSPMSKYVKTEISSSDCNISTVKIDHEKTTTAFQSDKTPCVDEAIMSNSFTSLQTPKLKFSSSFKEKLSVFKRNDFKYPTKLENSVGTSTLSSLTKGASAPSNSNVENNLLESPKPTPTISCPPFVINHETSQNPPPTSLPAELDSASFCEPDDPLLSKTTGSSKGAESWRKKIRENGPFQYICHLDISPPERHISFTVKGFVTTLLSKLEQKGGEWSLGVKINDGTGSLDVNIGDQVLKQLIGMSVDEFLKKKEEVANNPALKSSLAQNLGRCQRELIQMCGLMDIVVGPESVRPLVVKLRDFGEEHLVALKERLDIFSS